MFASLASKKLFLALTVAVVAAATLCVSALVMRFYAKSQTFAWDEVVAFSNGVTLNLHRVQTNKGEVPVDNPQHALSYFSHEMILTAPSLKGRFIWSDRGVPDRVVAVYLEDRGPVVVTLMWVRPAGQTGFWYREYLGLGDSKWTVISESKQPAYAGAYNILTPEDALQFCSSKMGKQPLPLHECTSPLRLKQRTPSLGIFQ